MQFSDLRLKTDIEEITDAMYIVSSMQGHYYRWKNEKEIEKNDEKCSKESLDHDQQQQQQEHNPNPSMDVGKKENKDKSIYGRTNGERVIGLIAQEVQQVLPEVSDSEKYLFLSTSHEFAQLYIFSILSLLLSSSSSSYLLSSHTCTHTHTHTPIDNMVITHVYLLI